jgi:CheY-like chemotaxis protein
MEALTNTGLKNILLVDDEEQLMLFIQKLLTREGYNVFLAYNGKEAIDIYKSNRNSIDLILMDIVMPVMSGVEACNELLALDPNIPIILMSAYPKDSFECFDHMHFIQKPMHPTDLFTFINHILNLSNTAKPLL